MNDLNAPVTRRELYQGMLLVWLFVVLTGTSTIGADASWRELLLPSGALVILALHAITLAKGMRRERATGDPAA